MDIYRVAEAAGPDPSFSPAAMISRTATTPKTSILVLVFSNEGANHREEAAQCLQGLLDLDQTREGC